ncbi:MAG: Bax inhibitor-1/YccA family protein [Candidatus Promineifilaceae bacterium]
MRQNFEPNIPLAVSQARVQETFIAAMQRVYLWMALGLAVTTIVALYVSTSEAALNFIFGNTVVFFGLLIGEFVLVIAVTAAVAKLSPGAALALFFGYAALNGATLAIVFLAYTGSSIFLTFGVTAALFAFMSILGYTTKQDLTKWGPILILGLVGFLIGSVANFFIASTALQWILTYVGIAIFLGLTVYDTQRIKTMTMGAIMQNEATAVSKIGILGALRLYLDFVNLFLLLLRIFGRRR